MNVISRLIDPSLAEALGWTLLHSLWQGAAIALILALLLVLSRSQEPQFRYLLSISALMGLVASAVATFVYLYEPNTVALISPGPLTAGSPEITPEVAMLPVTSNHPTVLLDYFQPHLPLIAAGWLLGVLLLGLRLIGEYAYLQHLKHYRCSEASPSWLNRLELLAQKMELRQQVQLRETARIHSPMVNGWLKPVILMPVGMLNSLSVAEVENILLHELAHVRRYDYIVNLLISVIETLFFFHPFVWWMGSRIRIEREHACDDKAIAISGNAATYVTALAHAESWRMDGRRLSMAFTGGSVLQRVQRILGQGSGGRLFTGKAAGAIFAAGLAGLLLTMSTPTKAEQLVLEEPEFLDSEEAFSAEEESGETDYEPSPEPNAEPQNQPAQTYFTAPVATQDTIPPKPDNERILEEEMREIERELREQELEIEAKAVEIEKELERHLQEQERQVAEIELHQKTIELELERAMQELESNERELELLELELERKELELEKEEEKLEQLEEKGENQAYMERLREFQKKELELLEAERQLEQQEFALEMEQEKLELQAEQQERALESRQRAMERKMHAIERQKEARVRQLHHRQQILEAEAAARADALKRRAKELERRNARKAE